MLTIDPRLAQCLGEALIKYASEMPTPHPEMPLGKSDTPTVSEPVPVETSTDGTAPPADSLPSEEPETPKCTDPARVDLHGVGFDSEFCADAKDPFYSSGNTSGQWKKRRGVDQKAYDEWYASQRPAAAEPVATEAPVDTSKAFAPATATAPAPAPEAFAPKSIGDFMAWCAERLADGNLTQKAIDDAYLKNGVSVPQLFTMEAAEMQQVINKLFKALDHASI